MPVEHGNPSLRWDKVPARTEFTVNMHVRVAACDEGPGVPRPAAAAAVAGDWQALIPGHVRRGVTPSRSQAGWADVAILSELVFAAQCRL